MIIVKEFSSRSYVFRLILALFMVFSLVGLAVFVLQIMLSTNGIWRGRPFVFWNHPINLLTFITIAYAAIALISLLMVFHLKPKWPKTSNLARKSALLLLLVQSAIFTLVSVANVINMERYGIVPSVGQQTTCSLIYSWGNSAMNHRFGRFYLGTSQFGLARKTTYVWSTEGSGAISPDSWEVNWKADVGTLNVAPIIGIDPDSNLPATFTCSP